MRPVVRCWTLVLLVVAGAGVRPYVPTEAWPGRATVEPPADPGRAEYMATNLITNGTLLTALAPWVGNGFVSWNGFTFHDTPGSARFEPSVVTSQLYQQVTTPATVQTWRLKFALYINQRSTNNSPMGVSLSDLGFANTYLDELIWTDEEQQWYEFSFDVVLPVSTVLYLYFVWDSTQAGCYFFLDDVSLTSVGFPEGTCLELKWELAKRRRDWGFFLHPVMRYEEVINRAIAEAPRTLWLQEADTSLTTVAETRRYSLATITEITETRQVRRVSMEDPDGHDYEIGRWRVENALGVLTLVLDEDPPEADRTLTIEYILPHEALDCTDDADETTLDREWLLARAMTLLLLEADPMLEDGNYISAELQRWDAVRQAREAQVGLRPMMRKARSWSGARWSR